VHPKQPTFRSQCSSHSQRFPPQRSFWTYFIPKPRSRFAFQGFSPLSASTAHRCFVPSAYSPRPPTLGKPSAPVLVAARSRFCSEKRSVTPTGGFSADAVRSPLRLFTPPGSSSMSLTAFRAASAHVLSEKGLTVTKLTELQRLSAIDHCFCPQKHGPAQDFLPELALRRAPKLDTRFR
jgi:hypothetical protein